MPLMQLSVATRVLSQINFLTRSTNHALRITLPAKMIYSGLSRFARFTVPMPRALTARCVMVLARGSPACAASKIVLECRFLA